MDLGALVWFEAPRTRFGISLAPPQTQSGRWYAASMFAGGRRAALASAVAFCACAQLLSLDDYTQESSSNASSAGSGGASAASGNGGSSGQNSGGAGLGDAGGSVDCRNVRLPDACTVPAMAVGVQCPAQCGMCEGSTCKLACSTGNKCSGVFTCPPEFACEVDCNSEGCEGLRVECAEGQDCRVNCNWNDACVGLDLVCSDSGPCVLWCTTDPQSCEAVNVFCGCNSCQANCPSADFSAPMVMCGESCDCQTCQGQGGA